MILHLPILKRFSFGFVDTDYATRLLSLLDFPSLTTFILEDVSKLVDPINPLDISPLLDWFSAPSQTSARNTTRLPWNQISILEIHEVNASREAFSRFLHQLTSLHHLSLYNIN